MTLAPQYPVVVLPGDGSNTFFNYDFEIPYQDDGITPAVLVQLQDGVMDPMDVDPSLFNITGVGAEMGGTVTYPLSGSPLPIGWFIIIKRNLYYSQGSAFPNIAFQPRQVENMGDRLEMQIQQLAADVGGGGSTVVGVASFNARTGAVTLQSSDVTAALGFTPLNKAGDTATGKINMTASNSARAGLGLAVGVDPSAPVDGDVWPTASALKTRIGGVTYDLTGGSGFDQDTPYFLGVNADADLNLVQRGSMLRALTDYGALGDGTTDDTAAWNKMVADVNAGIIKSIFIPAFNFFIPGDTTPFTRGCDIIGTGDNSLITSTQNTGTSIIINFQNIPFTDKVSLANFKMTSPTSATKVRQAIQVSWATESLVFSISNISIDGSFLRGIGVENSVVAHFSDVTINLYNYANHEWGWNVTATSGHYTVDMRWISCNVSGAMYAFKGSGHMQGLVFDDCVMGFSGYGVYLVNAAAGGGGPGLPGPELIINNCAMECIHNCVYLFGFADPIVSNCWTTNDAGTPGDSTFLFEDCENTNVHDNVLVGPATNWNGVEFRGACLTGLVHHNMFRLLAGAGVWCRGTTAYVIAENNNYYGPRSGSIPFSNASSSNTNIHKSTTTSDQTMIAFTGSSTAGFLLPTTLPVNSVFSIMAACSDTPVWNGEQYRIQAAVNLTTPNQDMVVFLRIREYNHRPTAPSPFPVFYVNFNRTSINDSRLLSNTLVTGKVCRFYIDTVVRVIANTSDAKWVLELATDNAAATAVCEEAGIWTARL